MCHGSRSPARWDHVIPALIVSCGGNIPVEVFFMHLSDGYLCVFPADIRMSKAGEEKPGADYPGDSSGTARILVFSRGADGSVI